MGKNKHVDLFKDMIPAVDMGLKELWDAATEEGQKEIKGDLWNLNRYISTVKSSQREIQEHFVLTVNEFYNKNWSEISKHPKLQWMTLCMCSHESKKTFFHEWLPLKKETNKKEELLLELFPNMKFDDVQTLAAITTKEELKQYCEDLGWDKKEINGLKL
jgi:hypothetical protein